MIDGAMAITTGLIMLLYSPKLAFLVIATILIFSAIRFALYGVIKAREQSALISEAKEETAFIESVSAIQTIKIFGRERERETAWVNSLINKINNTISVARIQIFLQSFQEVLFRSENILVIYFGAGLILSNSMSIGMLFAFMAYKRQFSENIIALIERLFEFRMLSLHLERVADISFERPEVDLDDPPRSRQHHQKPIWPSVPAPGTTDRQNRIQGCLVQVWRRRPLDPKGGLFHRSPEGTGGHNRSIGRWENDIA